MIIVYTIGHAESYENCLKSSPGEAYKMGKRNDYEGGSIWKTAEEAQAFINSDKFNGIVWADGKPRQSKDFSVYKVELVNGYTDISPKPHEDGYYELLVDSKFSK